MSAAADAAVKSSESSRCKKKGRKDWRSQFLPSFRLRFSLDLAATGRVMGGAKAQIKKLSKIQTVSKIAPDMELN